MDLSLLVRLRIAVPLFAASLSLYVISAIYTFVFTGAGLVMGTSGVIFSILIGASLAGFFLFARLAVTRGLLH